MTSKSIDSDLQRAAEPARSLQIFSTRAENVIRHLAEAVVPDNVDGIHGLRVAVRRFRTAMHDLGPEAAFIKAKKADKRLKVAASLAGAVRDHDVAISKLEKFVSEASEQPVVDGLRIMIAGRQKRRDYEFRRLTETLIPNYIEELADRIRDIAARSDDLIQADNFDSLRRSVIIDRRRAFLDLLPFLYDPFEFNGHHKLRIAAKHLRYSYELFHPPLLDSEETTADKIAEMQGHLGDKHDCDVWIGKLRKTMKRHLRTIGTTTPEFLAGEWILGEFVHIGAKHYREALDLWKNWRSTGFLESLTKE